MPDRENRGKLNLETAPLPRKKENVKLQSTTNVLHLYVREGTGEIKLFLENITLLVLWQVNESGFII